MRPGGRLTTHEYGQRLDEIADAFSGLYGEVRYGHVESHPGTIRKLKVEVDVPGYGEHPLATLVLIEKHFRSRAGDEWDRYEYLYDLQMEPRPSGRYAYHWHDDVPHRHCIDPRAPHPDHHYDDVVFDDIGWAARELFQMTLAGISCLGLRPLRDAPREPEKI